MTVSGGNSPAQGRITSGIQPGGVKQKTLEFIQRQLPAWRDDPHRLQTDAEEELNSQLCKFLNHSARREFPMVLFEREERQTKRRRVDLSASVSPLESNCAVIEGKTHTIYDPFLVLECKRLPAPERRREREYVVGTKTTSGGLQRFKLGLHGAKLRAAGMIAYVQNHSLSEWFSTINGWIDELTESDDPAWSNDDRLRNLAVDAAGRAARCESLHSRVDSESPQIHFTHLWIDMRDIRAVTGQ